MIVFISLIVVLLITGSDGFRFHPAVKLTNSLMKLNSEPSDTEPYIPKEVSKANSFNDNESLKKMILKIAGRTNRGESASPEEKSEVRDLIMELEMTNPTASPALSDAICGTWDLVFSDTQLFKSSPFFMAGRAVCSDGDEADRFNMFCDLHRQALAFTTIGRVRQIITPYELKNEFDTTGAVVPGLPFTVKGTIVSTASIADSTDNSWILRMESTRIKEGSSNVPLLKNFLDTSEGLPIQQMKGLLEQFVPSYSNPTPEFMTYFVDEDMRISRDQDDNVFVYKFTSSEIYQASSSARVSKPWWKLGPFFLHQSTLHLALALGRTWPKRE